MQLSSHVRLYQACAYVSILGILIFLLFPPTAHSESQSSTELSSAKGGTEIEAAKSESTDAKSEKPKKGKKGGSTTKNPFGFKSKPKGGLDAKMKEENKRRFEKFKEAEAGKSATDSEVQSSTSPPAEVSSPPPPPPPNLGKSEKPKKGKKGGSTTKNPFGFKSKPKGGLDAKMKEENKRRYEKFKEAEAAKALSASTEITQTTSVKSEKSQEVRPTERSESELPSSTADSQRKYEPVAKRRENMRRNKSSNQAGRSFSSDSVGKSDEMRQWADTKPEKKQETNENKQSLESEPKSDTTQDTNEDKQSDETSPKPEAPVQEEAPPVIVKPPIKSIPTHPGQGEDNANEPTKPPSESDEEDSSKRHRNFPTCKCKQKFRANYITTDDCGKAALCYWEIWNYNNKKNIAANLTNDFRTKRRTRCDLYYIQKYTCLIGYPKPRLSNDACKLGEGRCAKKLASLLYKECAPLRKFYGYPKPEDIQHTIDSENLNYALTQDDSTMFRPRPNSQHPRWNNYYTISCPMIYRHPYFTISLLLKDLDPTIEYSEASGLVGVAEMLPHYVRDAMNSERMLNFDALSIDESYIHWCGIPRNYVCVRQEFDPDSKMCDPFKLHLLRRRCGDPDRDPRSERVRTPMAGAFIVSRNRTKGARLPKPKLDGGRE